MSLSLPFSSADQQPEVRLARLEGLGALPELHDPRRRQSIAQTGPWDVRVVPETDPDFEALALAGRLHLQLWYPLRGLSLLTPSLLTGCRFQLARTSGDVEEWASLDDLLWDLERVIGAPRPNLCLVRALSRWLVDRPEATLRTAALAAGDPRVLPPDVSPFQRRSTP